MDKVIVLGAGGFLGTYICREFSRQGHWVIGIGRTTPACNVCNRFVPGELLEYNLVELLQAEKPRWVINAAGASSVGDSFSVPYTDWRKTVCVQARILEALRLSDIEHSLYFCPARRYMVNRLNCR